MPSTPVFNKLSNLGLGVLYMTAHELNKTERHSKKVEE